jgi:hypothetical protein
LISLSSLFSKIDPQTRVRFGELNLDNHVFDGFPLVLLKKIPLRSVAVTTRELDQPWMTRFTWETPCARGGKHISAGESIIVTATTIAILAPAPAPTPTPTPEQSSRSSTDEMFRMKFNLSGCLE